MYAESSASYPGPAVSVSVRNDLKLGVGWSFTTQYRVFGDFLTGKLIDGASWDSLVIGSAYMTIEALTPGVTLSSASSYNYAPVSEPGTWALWLSGLAALGAMARRRAAALGASAQSDQRESF